MGLPRQKKDNIKRSTGISPGVLNVPINTLLHSLTNTKSQGPLVSSEEKETAYSPLEKPVQVKIFLKWTKYFLFMTHIKYILSAYCAVH